MTHTGTRAGSDALTIRPSTGGTGDLSPGPVPVPDPQTGPDGVRHDVPADAPEGSSTASTASASITAALPGAGAGASPAGSGAVPVSAELEQLREEAAQCRRTIGGLRSDLVAAVQAHYDDVAVIGARLLAEAEDRGWCDDFDEVIDSLNAGLRVELPLRIRAWEASFHLQVTVRVERARNEDDARAQAAVIADQIERAVYGMVAVTASDAEDIDDFDIDQTD